MLEADGSTWAGFSRPGRAREFHRWAARVGPPFDMHAVDNEHVYSEVFGRDRVLVITRKRSRSRVRGALLAAYTEAACPPLAEHRCWTVLIDSREAPPDNGPELEAELASIRARLHAQFGRMVVVVKSAAGRLQAKRLNEREIVCGDLGEAMLIARSALGPPPA